MTRERFESLLRKNTGKADGYTFRDLELGMSIAEKTLRAAYSQGKLQPFCYMAKGGRKPLFSGDAAYSYYLIINK